MIRRGPSNAVGRELSAPTGSFMAAMLGFLILTAPANLPAQDLDTGLLAYYPFTGGSFGDSSGSGHVVAIHGAPTIVPGIGHKAEDAYFFDGVDDCLDLGFGGGTSYAAISYNLWVKSETALGGWNLGDFIAVYHPAEEGLLRIAGQAAGDGAFAVQLRGASGVTTGRWDDAAWHMLTLTYDGSEGILYVDGQPVLNLSETGPIEPDYNFFLAARLTDLPYIDEHVRAAIDEVRIYERALGVVDIAALYRQGLTAHWAFDDDTAADRSGQGHDGTIHGSPVIGTSIKGRGVLFDGIDDWVEITGRVADFGFASESATMAAWIQVADNADVYHTMLAIGKDPETSTQAVMILQKNRAGSGEGRLASVVDAQGYPANTYGTSIADGEALPKSVWIHIAGVVDAQAGEVRLYLDGVLQNTGTGLDPFDLAGGPDSLQVEIGRYFGSGYQNSWIDEVRVYGRALSETEIQSLAADYDTPVAGFTWAPTGPHGEIAFTNTSQRWAYGYTWNFGDGSAPSVDASPTHVFAEPGTYEVTLTAHGHGGVDNISTQTVTVDCLEAPHISAIEDVHPDQGGWVRVRFWRSVHDDDGLRLKNAELYSIQRLDDGEWTTVASVGAYAEDVYSALAPTQVDSGYAGGSGLTSFRVIAHVNEGNWASTVDKGYSVDDIAPGVPQGLAITLPTQLSWSPVDAEDLAYYSVHASADGSLSQDDVLLGRTAASSLDDHSILQHRMAGNYLLVTATDDNGNVGVAGFILDTQTGIDGAPQPLLLALAQNHPNPFNPRTTIEFTLPQAGPARLAVYDLSGRLVATLAAGDLPAGVHRVDWQGRDDGGRSVSSGTYLCRLRANGIELARLMMLVK